MSLENDTGHSNTAVHLAGLEQRVSGLERGIHDIGTMVTTLAQEIRQGQRTQWPVIWQAMAVAVTVLMAIGTMVYLPIKADQARLETAFLKLDNETVSVREADLRRRITESSLHQLEKRLDRLERP